MQLPLQTENGYLQIVASMLRWTLPAYHRLHISESTGDDPLRVEFPTLTLSLELQNPVIRLIRGSSAPCISESYEAFPSFGHPRMLLPSETQYGERDAVLRPRTRADRRKSAAGRAFVRSDRLFAAFSHRVVTDRRATSEFARSLEQYASGRTAVFRSFDRLSLRTFDNDGELQTIVKYVDQPADRSLARNEFERLHELRQIEGIRGSVPAPLGLVEDDTSTGLVTDPLPGDPAPAALSEQVLDFLRRCQLGPEIPVAAAEHICALRREVNDSPYHSTESRLIVERALCALVDHSAPRTYVHGDFTPWNMVIDDGHPNVFDWEYATNRGLPEWDRLFFTFQTGIHLQAWNQRQIEDAIASQLQLGSPYFNPNQLLALQLLVLVQVLDRAPQEESPQMTHVHSALGSAARSLSI